MARRLEIELTSARPDGTWTWRAAGALKPRGYLDASLLYEGARVGDVVRAEAEFGLEGIMVVAVEPPRPPEPPDPNIVTLVEKPLPAGVTTELTSRHPRARSNGRTSREGPGGPRRPGSGAPTGQRDGSQANAGTRRERRQDAASRPGRPPRSPGVPARPSREPAAPEASQVLPGPSEQEGSHAPSPLGEGHGARLSRPGSGTTAERQPKRGRGPASADSTRQQASGRSASDRPRQRRRLSPASTHRNALLESLPPEQRPIAQQLMRGGVPAVRTALYFERERAREEGRPEPSTEGVLMIAESLVGRVKAAEWRDRAEAALRAGDELSTRDLRSLVTSSDVARDEAAREVATQLREMLERRVEAARASWSAELQRLLDEGRVTQALRLSARPPDTGARLSAELAVRLRDAAGDALDPQLPTRRWLEVLVAVSESPVRRAVKPKGLPTNTSPELLEAARQQCGRVPGLAPLLGIAVPPPPGPLVRPQALLNAPVARRARRARPAHDARPAASVEPARPAAALPRPPMGQEGKAADEADEKATAGERADGGSAASEQVTAGGVVTASEEAGEKPTAGEEVTAGGASPAAVL